MTYAFGHHDKSSPTEYLKIHSSESGNSPLKILAAYLLYVSGKSDPVRADTIQLGDILLKKTVDAPTKSVTITKVEKILGREPTCH